MVLSDSDIVVIVCSLATMVVSVAIGIWQVRRLEPKTEAQSGAVVSHVGYYVWRFLRATAAFWIFAVAGIVSLARLAETPDPVSVGFVFKVALGTGYVLFNILGALLFGATTIINDIIDRIVDLLQTMVVGRTSSSDSDGKPGRR